MAILPPTGFETLSGSKVYYEETTRCNRTGADRASEGISDTTIPL